LPGAAAAEAEAAPRITPAVAARIKGLKTIAILSASRFAQPPPLSGLR